MSAAGDVMEMEESRTLYSHNETRLRTVVDTAVDGIILIDTQGGILTFNPACERLFGYRAEEMLGKNVKCLMPAPYSDEHDHHLDNYHRTGKRKIIGTGREVVGRRKDGMTFPMRLSVGEAVEEGKSVFVGIIHDLTESEESEAKYRGLLEAAPDAMVVVNQAGDIVLLNLQAEKQFGYRRDELLGQKVTNIIPKGFAERLIADDLRSAEDALAQQIGTGIELIARRKDGAEFPIEIMLSPLRNTEGILVTAAIRDISVRKAAETRLAQMEEERKRLERIKDEFVATVSHELRTPLTSIAGALGLLTSNAVGKLPDPASRLLTIAYTNSQRLIRLLNDILDIEKMESGKAVFNFKRVELRPLIEQTIEAILGFAKDYNVRIRLELGTRSR